ncbi:MULTISPECIES: stage III sporulation protein AE [Paenibacillus]|uniref:stage III sporulation protein AE n=1 Tax=Paenibacillus TaxID=44249 RepID=UPI002041F80D|nr:stage III sporulation protein AE [Paenibacillus camelliae]MCM3633175.1 stage III sporulation protein AE [Paenibacillus camelliae]
MKQLIWKSLLLLFILLQWPTVAAEASSPEAEGAQDMSSKWIQQQVDALETDSIEQYWNDLGREYAQYFPGQELPSITDMMFTDDQQSAFSGWGIIKGFIRFFLEEIIYNGKLLLIIVMLSIFSMMLETLQSAFEKKSISKIAYSIIFIVLVTIAINSFMVAMDFAKEAIEKMITFMLAMVPLLLTLLASMGGVVTVSVMHPLIIFMIHMVGSLIYLVVFPLLFFSAVLHIVSAITDRFKLTQLANMLRNIAVTVLGILLTVFLGVISVQGATSSITDGVALRTAKFVTGNFVPVVGKMFSDAADTIISASLVAKNAVGIAGVTILLVICAFPAIKIVALALIYHLSGAIMQPLGDSPIAACLQTIGKTMLYVFAALAAVSLMFFLAITIIITAGNATVMIR